MKNLKKIYFVGNAHIDPVFVDGGEWRDGRV